MIQPEKGFTAFSTRRRAPALLLSPVAWMIYFVLIYLLDEAACALNILRFPLWGRVTAVMLLMLVLTLLTLLLTLYAGYLGWKLWRQAKAASQSANQQTSEWEHETAIGRDLFVGKSGVMLSSLFVLLTLAVALSIVWLRPC
jgi:hypothetical protein